MAFHNFAEIQGPRQIVAIVTQRNRDGFTDCLQTCKMNDGINLMFLKDSIEFILVEQVDLMKSERLSGDLLYTVQGFCFTVAQVIDDDNLPARIQKFHAGMASDITGASGYQYRHHE
jgi:hypothetical protein